MMRLQLLISTLLAGASLVAAGPLMGGGSLIAQTDDEVKTCAQCASVCGLCPPQLYCPGCFNKNNCYACPYQNQCVVDKEPCICFDYCSKGTCKGTQDCLQSVLVQNQCEQYCKSFCPYFPAKDVVGGTICARALYQDMFRSSLPFGSGAGYPIGAAVDAVVAPSAMSEPGPDILGLNSLGEGGGGGAVALADAAAAPPSLPVDIFSGGDALFPSSSSDSSQPDMDPYDDMAYSADMFPMASTYVDDSVQAFGVAQGGGLGAGDGFLGDVWPVDA